MLRPYFFRMFDMAACRDDFEATAYPNGNMPQISYLEIMDTSG